MPTRTLNLGPMMVCAVAFATSAGAADLRMPVKAPVPAPVAVFNWSGCYLGGYIGGAFADKDPVFTDLGNANFRAFSGGVTAGRVEDRHSWDVPLGNSVIAGGTLGCNWQPVGSAFVFGVEGEAGYLKLRT
jgi:outer membrane immunogenic protein